MDWYSLSNPAFEAGETSGEKTESESETGNVQTMQRDDESEFTVFENPDFLEFDRETGNKGDENCFCKQFLDLISPLCLMNEMAYKEITLDNYNCFLDNIIRCYNHIFSSSSKLSNHIFAFTDLFYRIRHELLFKVLCKSYNINAEHSDTKFSEFGINSNRTPDLIINKNNTLYIIEVTATSSFERAASSKGIESAGFESKYKKEIDQMNELGIKNIYIPLFFNMGEITEKLYSPQFVNLDNDFHKNEPYFRLLPIMQAKLSELTHFFRKSIMLPSTILFSEWIDIKPNHEGLKFLYKTKNYENTPNYMSSFSYKENKVSSQIYKKVSNSWDNISWTLDNLNKSNSGNFILVLEARSNKFRFQKNNVDGVSIEEFEKIIMRQDKIKLFELLYIKAGDALIKSTQNDKGITFYERQNDEVVKSGQDDTFKRVPQITDHLPVIFDGKFDISKYEKYTKAHRDNKMFCNYLDFSYEDEITNCITEFDKNGDYGSESFNNFLGGMEASKIDIDSEIEKITPEYTLLNSLNESLPIRRLKVKAPFVLPIANVSSRSYCGLDYKNTQLYNGILSQIEQTNPFTAIILRNVNSDNFTFYNRTNIASKELKMLFAKRSTVSNEINQLQRSLIREGSTDSILKISKTTDTKYSVNFRTLKSEYNALTKNIKELSNAENFKQDIKFIRLPTKVKRQSKKQVKMIKERELYARERGHDNKIPGGIMKPDKIKADSFLSSLFEKEMEHFKVKNRQSTTEGVGFRTNIEDDYNTDKIVYDNLCNTLLEYRGENKDQLIDIVNKSKDVKLLSDLKEVAINEYKILIKEVKDSLLGHSSAFISRLAHSLMFYSQMTFNSEYIRVDNLGYKDCLLIVRGGKKIFKSKSSKLFRLVYPIVPDILQWYTCHKDRGSQTILEVNGVLYMLTPWMMLHESILTDSLSFYTRICSFAVLNLNPKMDLKSQFNSISMNILLAYHNRRQTEVLLANLRYILLSTLGDYTGVAEILKEFFGFNYDCFQSFVRNSILKNYPSYFKTVRGLKEASTSKNQTHEITLRDFQRSSLLNIFTSSPIQTTEDLALMIYSTFLMTKAPYQKIAERARNIKGMLSVHEMYDDKVGLKCTLKEQFDTLNVTCEGDLQAYSRKLFKNDFAFDAKYCALVGNFMDSYLSEKGVIEDLHSSWIKIMSSTWDEMSTSTGLRGDYDKVEDFWGQKGYFVVYKDLLQDKNFYEDLLSLFNCDMPDESKRRILRQLNKTYLEKSDMDREFLIFHAVDKVQWRGGREIFVMDIFTKSLQQPIEKFMCELCKEVDTELISIPSNKRAQVIHHSIFEKDLPLKDAMTWYLTLDCTKWAPKSIFTKFAVLILSMKSLPASFKIHFLNYLEKLHNKRVYFNNSEVEAVMNNVRYTEVCKKYLQRDDKVNGYYLEMPYSWVMGIFNYTSSFMHVANQKYCSYLILKTSMQSYSEETIFVMFAHSDDSGGRLTVPNVKLAKRALILYELNLKCCNHLLSKKKSVISRIYFEILSIIYLFKQLLALLPKFLGGLRFLPTDKGFSQDIMQSYSKSIEVMVSGANFNIAYLVMKFYSTMIWRFYVNKDPCDNDYTRPTQYMGMPDAHPLMLLLCGSDADILRINMQHKEELLSLMSFVNLMLPSIDDEGPIKPIKFSIKVRGLKKDFEPYIEAFSSIIEKWCIRNVNYHNTGFNTLNLLSKLNDPGFIGSLVNESVTRRISRCYYLRKGPSIETRIGPLTIENVLDSFNLLSIYNCDKSEGVHKVLEGILTESEIESIEHDYLSNKTANENNMKILTKTLQSPLKICNYLNELSMEGKALVQSSRTLKPTMLQLYKSSRVFTKNFDPASLVAYMKQPEFNWAISDNRNLYGSSLEAKELLDKLGLDYDGISEDSLLKVFRTFGKDNIKTIYMYSKVPSEVRQIKSYSAFLSFLAVNTFSDKEIQGFVLKLNEKDMSKEYIESNVGEEMYVINNILTFINVISTKSDAEFTKQLSLKTVEEIGWEGGIVSDFLIFLLKNVQLDPGYCYVCPMLLYLLNLLKVRSLDSEIFLASAFYTYLKSQRVKSGWFGKGEIYISIENSFYSIVLENNNIKSVYGNSKGRINTLHVNFINDVLAYNGVSITSALGSNDTGSRNKNDLWFGYDSTGHLTIGSSNAIEFGVSFYNVQSRGDIVNHIKYGEMAGLNKNSINFTINDGTNNSVKKRVYFLPIRKTEILLLMKKLLDPNQFKDKLDTMGLNDFEDFLLTEVLTEFGTDLYVNFREMIDNYKSTRTYEIFQKINKMQISKMPTQISPTIIPAPEGSYIRMVIDYTNNTDDKLIRTDGELNQSIMQLRSEYPETMSILLSENLVKYHRSIYNNEEQKEISDNYHIICQENDINEMRSSIIKLMTIWGYGSLVHSIQNYTLKRGKENYLYFNLNMSDKDRILYFSKAYESLIKSITTCMLNWSHSRGGLVYPIKRFCNLIDYSSIPLKKIYNDVMYTYGRKYRASRNSIGGIVFNNTLLALMEEEGFNAELQDNIKNNYILGSIPINNDNSKNFIILVNTLSDIWIACNTTDYSLEYSLKNERLPDHVPHFKSKMKAFDFVTPPSMSYYSGFIDAETLGYIQKPFSIKSIDTNYRIITKISKPSSFEIPMNDHYIFQRPVKEDVFELEVWPDLIYEFEMVELDTDTIDDMIEEIEDMYKDKVTRVYRNKGNKIVNANIHWILAPFYCSKHLSINMFRQVHENIVVISNEYMSSFKRYYPNSGVRLIDYSVMLGNKPNPMFAHYSFDSDLNNDFFITHYIGGDNIEITPIEEEVLLSKKVRDSDGIVKNSNALGVAIGDDMLTNVTEFVERDGIISVKRVGERVEGGSTSDSGGTDSSGSETDPQVVERQTTEVYKKKKRKMKSKGLSQSEISILKKEKERLKRLHKKLRFFKKRGMSEQALKRLEQKYTQLNSKSKMSIKLLLDSIMREGEMNMVLENIMKNREILTEDEQTKIFQSPIYTTLIYSLNRIDRKIMRDPKASAELNAMGSMFGIQLPSGTLTIDAETIRLCKSNFKLWFQVVKSAKIKKENKLFLLTFFTSIVNSARPVPERKENWYWQELINNITNYLADDDEMSELTDLVTALFIDEPTSRFKYKAAGY